MLVIYDLSNNGICCGVFDKVTDVAKFFGVSKYSIFRNLRLNRVYRQRYQIMRINLDEED